jgi:HSP20 family molecular chaperone IbpA
MMPRDIETLMWVEACEMLERAERLRRQFFQLGEQIARGPSWEPPVDVFETDRELCILVALPGVEPTKLEVAIEDGMLIVVGERVLPAAARTGNIHRLEIPHGRFGRRIALPPGRYQVGQREMVNGCLVLSLQKRTP